MRLKGSIVYVRAQRGFDVALELAPFSPRRLVSALHPSFPVRASDPNVLTRFSLRTNMRGTLKSLSLSDGKMDLDQSKIFFSARAKDFHKPDLIFKINLDQIDIDCDLPPADAKKPATEKSATTLQEKKEIDYAPLRKMVLVAGTFSSPRFAPDHKGVPEKTLKDGIPSPSVLRDVLKGETTKPGRTNHPALMEKGKDFLRGLPLGR